MRLSRIFQLSFAGSLLFSPAMAQEADQMHQEALRVLHQSMGQSASGQVNSAPISTPTSTLPSTGRQMEDAASKARSEREMRLNAEAQKNLDERDKAQEQRRKEFEQYVKDREKLRQQQRDFDEKISTQRSPLNGTVATNSPASSDLHVKALDVLHQTEAQMAPPASTVAQPALQPSTTPGNAAPAGSSDDELQRKALEILRAKKAESSAAPQTAPVTEPEGAPRVVAGSTSTMVAQSNSDAQERALEILHQKMQAESSGSAPASAPPAAQQSEPSSPQPSPYLQQRLKEIQAETAVTHPTTSVPSAQSVTSAPAAAQPAATPVPESYVQELERTAREAAQQRAAATAAITGAPAATTPIIDPKLRDMLERQNREISRESGFNPAVTTASQPYYFPRRGLSPDAEAKARQILEQEQGLIPTPSSSAANAPAAPAASTAPAMTAPAEPAAPAPAVAPAITASTPSASASAAMAPSGTIAPDDSQVRYSKELEERARQILLQRAQNQSTAAAHAAPAPASPVPTTQPSAPEMRPAGSAASAASVAPATQAPASPASGVAAAKAASEAQADEIHARALETLNQIESGKAPQPAAAGPMSKQERLRAITDLYKADKMSPAEYHRQRAAIIASPN